MKKISVFIESKGKIKKVKSLFEELGFENVNVISTKGRIMDLPLSRYGINNDNFSKFVRVPLSERKMNEVASSLLDTDVAFLLTDDDIEGEIIAYDLSNIAIENKDIEVYRVRCKSLTYKDLESALSSSGELIKSKIIGGLSRRIFDRYIGYNFTKPKPTDGLDYGYVGRITTPVLSSLNSNEFHKAWISRSIDKEGETFNVKVPVFPDELEIAKDIFSSISDIHDPDIVVFSEETFEDDTSPWNGRDALINLSSALSLSVIEVSDVLQELYEEGKISYPRTDSFYLSKETVNAMKKMAQEFGVSGFDDEFFLEKAELLNSSNSRSQDAHEAITPISSELNIYTPLSELGIKDQILSLMTRNILRSGQKDRKITRKKASFSSSKANNIWNYHLSKLRSSPIIERVYSHSSFGPDSEIINETKPLGSLEGTSKKGFALMRILDNQEIVLRRIKDLDLGRPSTDSSHSSKIASKFMSKNGDLNMVGLASIAYAMQIAPNLSNPDISKKIEDSLHNTGGSIDERVNLAISLSGIDTSSARAFFEHGRNNEFDNSDDMDFMGF